jgi:methionyl-tRNA formyltransferase
MKRKMTVVGFLARAHGLNGLIHLLASDRYDLVHVFTHRLNPGSEDPARAQREDFGEYKTGCEQNKIPLTSIDSKEEARGIGSLLTRLDGFDFIVSISWRRLIPADQLRLPTIGGVNLHRGKLPEYKGAEPIKQALHHGDDTIVITAHHLSEEIDSGETIGAYTHPVNLNQDVALEANISRLKKELTPHFGPLLIQSLDSMADRHESR